MMRDTRIIYLKKIYHNRLKYLKCITTNYIILKYQYYFTSPSRLILFYKRMEKIQEDKTIANKVMG